MRRRAFLRSAGAVALQPALAVAAPVAQQTLRRVRPSDPDWPGPEAWAELNKAVSGRLAKVPPLLAPCAAAPDSAACATVLQGLKNPYFIAEQPAGTQTSGWLDAWTSQPSTYVVAARRTADVVAAVSFARNRRLRLVVKGGGHSYLGGSNAADSLLLWMRGMDAITLHDHFVPQGCLVQHQGPVHAVSVQTGARWLPVYEAVTTRAGRYVQGGGCTTVGVAGFILGGGFGSFSKRHGTGALHLLEAEIVTADGAVRIANACTNRDLFWALRGGGIGSFGVVTRLTLQTFGLPRFAGVVMGTIKASSDEAFKRLIARFNDLYATRLFNRHWGESVSFTPQNSMALNLVFHDLDQHAAETAMRPLQDFVAAAPLDYTMTEPFKILAISARRWWDTAYLSKHYPFAVVHDPRPGAPPGDVWWAGNQGEVGFFIHGYESVWLPSSLIDQPRRATLTQALFDASRHFRVALHFNKGLAGAPEDILAAVRRTPMNPAVTHAFALAIVARGGPPAYSGMPGDGPDLPLARRNAEAIGKAIGVLRAVAPKGGSYVSEAGFTDPDWQRNSYGPNYPRLLAVKRKYDPDGLFVTHHGVGSEAWSADGFVRV
ncbi:MAG: FAD-binding oxidoreductase [Proteobacteria bacterium]|nr:FAD-binding oxidoreductase [Pseudomonadota bacterium]